MNEIQAEAYALRRSFVTFVTLELFDPILSSTAFTFQFFNLIPFLLTSVFQNHSTHFGSVQDQMANYTC